MNWIRLRGALIRAFWTFVLPALGAVITYLLRPGMLEEFGITDGTMVLAIGAVLYGVKKAAFPNTVL